MEGQGPTREMQAPMGPHPTYTCAKTNQSKTVSTWGKEFKQKKKERGKKKEVTEDLQTVWHSYLSAGRKVQL